jgi:hypothetical protein
MSAYKTMDSPTFNYIVDLYCYYPAWYFYLVNCAKDGNRSLYQCVNETFLLLPNLRDNHKQGSINLFEIKMCVNRRYITQEFIEIGYEDKNYVE